MVAAAVLGGPETMRWDTVILCLLLSVVTLCAGYSVGIHRRLIHNSFQCPQWVENVLVYIGVLAGQGGPFSAIERHDLRDWAQRQPRCHDFFANRRDIFTDAYWQLHCDIALEYPPIIRYEPRIARNRFYHWLEQTWMLQQVPLGVALYHIGGWAWVFWGVYVRIALCATLRWLFSYLSRHFGDRPQWVQGAGVQSHNLPLLGLLSFGESWQNHHQAFPGSARFGLLPNQFDPGWWFIKGLESVGLAWNIRQPDRFIAARMPSTTAAAPIQPSPETRQKATSYR